MHFSDAVADQVATNALAAIAPTVTINTTVTPPITIPIAPDLTQPAGPPDPLMSFLRPVVTFNTLTGPLTIAPFGTGLGAVNDETTWAIVVGASLAALVAGCMYLGASLAKGK